MGVENACRRVHGIAVNIWHRRHAAPPVPDRCAGCGARLDGAVLDLGGNTGTIHWGETAVSCLRQAGRWRTEAANALAALGIEAPA